MATWERLLWESGVVSGVPRRDRLSGDYNAYLPDRLEGRAVPVDGRLGRLIAEAERHIRTVNGADAHLLAQVSRFLLRSEAIASSRIEGVAPSPKNVALAELGSVEVVAGVSDQARLVANNLMVVQESTTRLVHIPEVTVEDVEMLHAALLPDDVRQHGTRTVQNWIGGSDFHPIQSDYVPPHPQHVPALMADLVGYLNGAADSPLVQAALVHAQFETIHPFVDGNGRVGRALIHTVLARRGLTTSAVLPVSLVLSTLRQRYVDGLTAYRYSGAAGDAESIAGIRAWIEVFTEATIVAAQQAEVIVADIRDLKEEWQTRLLIDRARRGVRAAPRSDSATSKLMDLMPSAPVLTSRTVQRLLHISPKAALVALSELHQAKILQTKNIGWGTTAYVAGELLDVVTFTERRLASTNFDTRISPPTRPVPDRPTSAPDGR